MNQAYFHTSYTPTQFANHSSRGQNGHLLRLRTDKNGTRIAARWNLLYSALRDMIPIKQYAAGHKGEIEWCSTAEAWRDIMELEAVLVISKVLTTTAQFEKPFTGAWPNIAKAQVQSKLFAETIDVFDLLKAYHGEVLPRLARKGGPPLLWFRSSLHQLRRSPSRSSNARTRRRRPRRVSSLTLLRCATPRCATSSRGSSSAGNGSAPSSITTARGASTSPSPARRMRLRSFSIPITYGFYFRTHIALVHRRTTSTTSILKTTSSTSFTWTLDGFTATLRSSFHGLASFLPAMASCSTGQIGALMAESFCERILSCAKQVVHRHRLSYKAEEYSMVVILRMNRAFMEYMRKHEKDYEPGK